MFVSASSGRGQVEDARHPPGGGRRTAQHDPTGAIAVEIIDDLRQRRVAEDEKAAPPRRCRRRVDGMNVPRPTLRADPLAGGQNRRRRARFRHHFDRAREAGEFGDRPAGPAGKPLGRTAANDELRRHPGTRGHMRRTDRQGDRTRIGGDRDGDGPRMQGPRVPGSAVPESRAVSASSSIRTPPGMIDRPHLSGAGSEIRAQFGPVRQEGSPTRGDGGRGDAQPRTPEYPATGDVTWCLADKGRGDLLRERDTGLAPQL